MRHGAYGPRTGSDMHVILMGPQGSGKGTQAGRLAPRLGLMLVATGDLFRAAIRAETDLGKQIKAIYDAGGLVSDDITVALVEERLDEIATRRGLGERVNGAIYDGFPRTRAQAEALDAALAKRDETVTAVVQIDVPRETLIRRLAGRRICSNCGRVYNIDSNPPKVAGVCDICGGALIQRQDDTEDAVRRRLDLYFAETEPLTRYYRERGLLQTIDGDRDIDAITEDLVTLIERANRIAAAGKTV
jgi:adenylate kinase